MLFDTHVHLNDKKYTDDLLEVIERAKNEGVTRMLVVGCDQLTNQRAIELAEKSDNYLKLDTVRITLFNTINLK